MNYLYLLLNISSVFVPFVVSFHPRLKFYKKWPFLLISMVLTNIVFISWDIWFTKIGVWGFNSDYLVGYSIFNLPIEEWLFFICIPYACVFMHYAILELKPKFSLSSKLSSSISNVLLIGFMLLTIFNYDKLYTLFNYSLAIVLLLIVKRLHLKLLSTFYITFLFMLLPFFIVNGVLTGAGIQNQIVWYNNVENLGIRMYTIPFEDATYAFTLILSNIFIIERLQRLKVR